MKRDDEQLSQLAIAHYVVAALVALSSCLPIVHVVMGFIFAFHPPENRSGEPFPWKIVGLLVAGTGILIILLGWMMAICIALAGRSIQQRLRYYFCMAVAGFMCLFPPLCTLLGVFTLIVLSRPSVQIQFGRSVVTEDDFDDIPFADADDRDATTS